MDLLLWRHAEAEEGEDDLRRALTERGVRQARRMAAWIRARQLKDLRIVVSPAVRTQQTAEALKLLAGVGTSLAGRLLMLDGRSMEWSTLHVQRAPDCAVCGAR